MKFTIGTDPEFILSKNNKIVSAIGIIKRTKKKRLRIEETEYYYDNVLAECSIKPSSNKEEFVYNVEKAIEKYKEIIRPAEITNFSSFYFSDNELLHPDAKKAGCAPEYCAYTLSTISSKKINKILKKTNLRTAGGHVHLGTELGKNHNDCVMLVRTLDLFLGFSSLFLDNKKESVERRVLFGQPGRYRQPSHGVEYRTLSNFWLFDSRLVELVYDICEFSINFVKEKKYENFWKVDYEKLDSDDFWNNDGDPANCHKCHGYDCVKFRNLFVNRDLDYEKNILEIINYYLDKNIINQIRNLLFRPSS
jgi:hypothetical protein